MLKNRPFRLSCPHDRRRCQAHGPVAEKTAASAEAAALAHTLRVGRRTVTVTSPPTRYGELHATMRISAKSGTPPAETSIATGLAALADRGRVAPDMPRRLRGKSLRQWRVGQDTASARMAALAGGDVLKVEP